MKQVQVWPNHVRIPHLDLVLYRAVGEPLGVTLDALAHMGFDVTPDNVEIVEGVQSG